MRHDAQGKCCTKRCACNTSLTPSTTNLVWTRLARSETLRFFLKHAAHTTNQSSALCVHKAEPSYQYLPELATRTTSMSAALLQVTRQAALAKPVPDMPRLAKATPTLAHIRRALFSTWLTLMLLALAFALSFAGSMRKASPFLTGNVFTRTGM